MKLQKHMIPSVSILRTKSMANVPEKKIIIPYSKFSSSRFSYLGGASYLSYFGGASYLKFLGNCSLFERSPFYYQKRYYPGTEINPDFDPGTAKEKSIETALNQYYQEVKKEKDLLGTLQSQTPRNLQAINDTRGRIIAQNNEVVQLLADTLGNSDTASETTIELDIALEAAHLAYNVAQEAYMTNIQSNDNILTNNSRVELMVRSKDVLALIDQLNTRHLENLEIIQLGISRENQVIGVDLMIDLYQEIRDPLITNHSTTVLKDSKTTPPSPIPPNPPTVLKDSETTPPSPIPPNPPTVLKDSETTPPSPIPPNPPTSSIPPSPPTMKIQIPKIPKDTETESFEARKKYARRVLAQALPKEKGFFEQCRDYFRHAEKKDVVLPESSSDDSEDSYIMSQNLLRHQNMLRDQRLEELRNLAKSLEIADGHINYQLQQSAKNLILINNMHNFTENILFIPTNKNDLESITLLEDHIEKLKTILEYSAEVKAKIEIEQKDLMQSIKPVVYNNWAFFDDIADDLVRLYKWLKNKIWPKQ